MPRRNYHFLLISVTLLYWEIVIKGTVYSWQLILAWLADILWRRTYASFLQANIYIQIAVTLLLAFIVATIIRNCCIESDGIVQPSAKHGKVNYDDKNISNYKLFAIPRFIIIKNYFMQVIFDLVVYIIPIIGMVIYHSTVELGYFLSFYFTFFIPLYNFMVLKIWLKPSPIENKLKAASRLKSYGEVYGKIPANGWYKLLHSHELKNGDVRYVELVGREFALFRGYDGVARCIDAYCIHLGANLAIGGKVIGSCIQCPFHQWTFNGHGEATCIPYSEGKIPSNAKTRSYYITEYYGEIMVWIHKLDSKPDYHLPTQIDFENGNMVHVDYMDTEINMHLLEFVENSTDFAHFQPLHGQMTIPFTPIIIPGLTVNHSPDWKEGKKEKKDENSVNSTEIEELTENDKCYFFDNADLSLFNCRIPGSSASAMITIIGCASVVTFTFKTPIGNIIILQTHTPHNSLIRMNVSFSWFATRTMPRFLVFYIVGNWISQWQNDILIWENKKYILKPLPPVLVRGDGPMNKSRRYVKKFYTFNTDESNNPEENPTSCAASNW